MDVDNSMDYWIMEETPISELVEDEGQKLIYVFDYMTERSFFMELKEIQYSTSLKDPFCERKVGSAPAQHVDVDNFIEKTIASASAVASASSDEFGEEFYGSDSYDDEELEQYASGYDDEFNN